MSAHKTQYKKNIKENDYFYFMEIDDDTIIIFNSSVSSDFLLTGNASNKIYYIALYGAMRIHGIFSVLDRY